jgi:hypothetical protein
VRGEEQVEREVVVDVVREGFLEADGLDADNVAERTLARTEAYQLAAEQVVAERLSERASGTRSDPAQYAASSSPWSTSPTTAT